MVIKVPVLKIGALNSNDRIYTELSVDMMIMGFVKISQPVFGQIGFGDNQEVSLNSVSHLVKSMSRKNGVLFAEIKILETPCGKTLKDNLDLYVFRPRSLGRVLADKTVKIEKFISIDAVPNEDDPYKGYFDGYEVGRNYGI